MAQGQQPARLAVFYAATLGTVNHPASRLDLLARQTLQRRLIEAGQLRRTDTQHQRSVQLNPQATTIALYALNPPTQHGETRVTQLLRSQDWRLFPQALTGFARLLLGHKLASDLSGIGGDGWWPTTRACSRPAAG